MKPAHLAALLVAFVIGCGLTLGLSGAADAHAPVPSKASADQPKQKCDGGLSKAKCLLRKAAPFVSPGGVLVAKGAQKAQESAGATLKSFTPAGVVDEWAKSAAQASTGLLVKLQKQLLDSTKPKLDTKWWSGRYAVCYGIGLVLMAFTMTISLARFARGGPEAAMVARETLSAAILYVPVVVAAPLVVMTFVDMANALAHWFGTSSSKDAGTAISAYVDRMNKLTSPSAIAGGSLTLLLFAGVIFVAAVAALLELAFSEFGVYFLTLLFPVVAGLGVNPRWRAAAARVIGALVGAVLVPAVLFFAFWVVWGAFSASTSAKAGSDLFGLLAFVMVGVVACVFAPVVIGAILGHLIAGGADSHESASRGIRQAGMSAGRSITRSSTRMASVVGRRGYGGGGGGGGSSMRPRRLSSESPATGVSTGRQPGHRPSRSPQPTHAAQPQPVGGGKGQNGGLR